MKYNVFFNKQADVFGKTYFMIKKAAALCNNALTQSNIKFDICKLGIDLKFPSV